MKTTLKSGLQLWIATTATGLVLGMGSLTANAGAILVINGASVTSEPGTTTLITDNLSNLLVAAGHTVTVVDGVPGSLAAFDQVWDIRFSNSSPISGAEQADYVAYMAAGHGMFVMGENGGFMTRNNTVLSLIQAAGGGSLTFGVSDSLQTVLAPFNAPNPIGAGNVNYAAPGGVTGTGTGQFISVDANGLGAGVAFGIGDLSNALNGGLTAIFDVNFMQGTFDQPDSQNLLRNLIGFVDNPVRGVPEPFGLGLLGIGLAGLLAGRRRAAV